MAAPRNGSADRLCDFRAAHASGVGLRNAVQAVSASNRHTPYDWRPLAGGLRVHDVDRTPVSEGGHRGVSHLLEYAFVIQ